MSRLYDRASQKWVVVPDNEITGLVGKGTHAFETGIDIPVVAPNGEIGTIPADQAERAFREGGYRWQTAEDRKQFELAKNEEILKQHYDNSSAAFLHGVARGGTFGASDVIVPAVADMLGADGEAVRQGIVETRDRSPIAAGAGQVAGTLINPAMRAAGEAAYGAGANAGSKLASATASKIVEKVAPVALGSAVEGAFYGAGDGISEAALGKPDEIAENLMAGPVAGALFGGGFGAAFGATKLAATPLKKAISYLTEEGAEATSSAMRSAARNTLAPALSLKGEKELAKIVRDMTDEGSYAVRQAYFDGGAEAAEKIANQYRQAELAARTEAKQLKRELGDYVKTRPKRVREEIQSELDNYKGDLTQAVKGTYEKYVGQRSILESTLQGDMTPSQTSNLIDELTNKTIKKLETLGDNRAKLKAGELSEYINAQKVANNLRSNDALQGISNGREMLIMNELRDRARRGFGKASSESQQVLRKYIDDVSYVLHNNPQYGADFKRLDDMYDAFDGFRSFGSKMKTKGGVLDKVRYDPEFANEFDTIVNNFGDLVPEMSAFALSLIHI